MKSVFAAPAGEEMVPLDYGRSFLRGTSAKNSVRFWIESRTRIIDAQRNTSTDYYQCASCKSENTFGEKDLFYDDNYDFLPIFGGANLLVFRRKAWLNPDYRSTYAIDQLWGQPELLLHEARQPVELTEWPAIRDATQAGQPIVTQTELANEELGLRAIIECPAKTMNISLDRQMYQNDTGPIALPDLGQRYDREIDSLRLAFIAFNAPHFADFVVEGPTPIVDEGTERATIYHYSQISSLPAKNRLFALT
ncbi:MAG: hypothetical protein KF708_04415 [Pirellulales bacterium]|nr:hypothetical protein [Pirellulales bacterium]